MSDTTVSPMSKNQALHWLFQNSPVTIASYPELGRVFGWERTKTWKIIKAWRQKGYVETETAPDTGRITVTVVPTAVPIAVEDDVPDDEETPSSPPARELSSVSEGRSREAVPAAGEPGTPAVATIRAYAVGSPQEHLQPASRLDWMLTSIGVATAFVTAYFSIHGLLTIFPGDVIGVTVFGICVECLKVGGVMYLSRHASSIWWLWRWLAILAVVVAAGLNSASVYAKFASLHSQSPAAAAATREAAAAELDAQIERYEGRVKDLTRRAAVNDGTLDNIGNLGRQSANPGNKNAAAKAARAAVETLAGAMARSRQDRAALTSDLDTASNELASLKARRGRITAADHQASAEELPLLLMANLGGTNIATVLRYFVVAIVICGDPAALILLAAVGSRRRGVRRS